MYCTMTAISGSGTASQSTLLVRHAKLINHTLTHTVHQGTVTYWNVFGVDIQFNVFVELRCSQTDPSVVVETKRGRTGSMKVFLCKTRWMGGGFVDDQSYTNSVQIHIQERGTTNL